MDDTPHYEQSKKEGLSLKQQKVYDNLQTINSQITNIDLYLSQGNYDQAMHAFHLILEIYNSLNDESIPFTGKEILHDKVNSIREKIKEKLKG